MKQKNLTMIVVFEIFCLFSQTVQADLFFDASGTSAKGVAVSFSAQLSIAGDNLTIVLTNTSVQSLNPDDCLSSFYFDIINGDGVRPTLTYDSATGDVYLGDKDNPDPLQTAGADLMALAVGDGSWQYKAMDPTSFPFLGFGIGTAGYSALSPNNFDGNYVDGINYSIYAGDISTANLNGQPLVLETATFTFTGLTGFTEADIAPLVMFGLGTSPDSYFYTPLPGAVLLGMLGLGVVGIKLRKYA